MHLRLTHYSGCLKAANIQQPDSLKQHPIPNLGPLLRLIKATNKCNPIQDGFAKELNFRSSFRYMQRYPPSMKITWPVM